MATVSFSTEVTAGQIIGDPLAFEHARNSLIRLVTEALAKGNYFRADYTIRYVWTEHLRAGRVGYSVTITLGAYVTALDVNSYGSLEDAAEKEKIRLFDVYLKSGYEPLEAALKAIHKVDELTEHIDFALKVLQPAEKLNRKFKL